MRAPLLLVLAAAWFRRQDGRLWAWITRHRVALSLVALVTVTAMVLLVIPDRQVCQINKDSGHENCSFHNTLSVGLFGFSQFLSDFGAAITGLATLAIAAFTATLWYATRGMQKATTATLDHLEKEFTAEHRPWVTLECKIVGPLKFEHDAWDLPITYAVKNLGRTPAINLIFAARLLPRNMWVDINRPWMKGNLGEVLPVTNMSGELDAVSAESESLIRSTRNWGEVLFPTEWDERPSKPFARQPLFTKASKSPSYTGQFLLVASVVYGSTLSDQLFRTGKAFAIWNHEESIDAAGEILPIDRAHLGVNWERSVAT